MALTKIINDGDELVFDLSEIATGARKDISIIMVKRARPANILVIRADRSIRIRHVKQSDTQYEETIPMELPLYRCHKLVQAAKITKIELNGMEESISTCPHAILHFGLIGKKERVDDSWIAKHNPHEGGYLVIYEDGYKSFSPGKAFEQGYLPV